MQKKAVNTLTRESRGRRRTHELVDTARVHLEVQLASDRVLPANRQSLDQLLLPRRQILNRHLLPLRLHSESRRAGFGGADRDVGVGEVADFGADGEGFVGGREDVKHDLARNDCESQKASERGVKRKERRKRKRTGSATEGNLQLVARSVVVADGVLLSERGDETVERSDSRSIALIPVDEGEKVSLGRRKIEEEKQRRTKQRRCASGKSE
jgi:hypothetical protein